MHTYIAFLRGINVSGQKKIKMVDLKECLQKAGLLNVGTYIQSGNVIFETQMKSRQAIATLIVRTIKEDFGFEVPVVVTTGKEIEEILEHMPFDGDTNPKGLYFALLHETPKDERVTSFLQLRFENEDFHYTHKCVYLNCKAGAGKAKLNNNLIENKLKVVATTRNLNTMRKMLTLAHHVS